MAILTAVSKSMDMGRERGEWRCSSRAHLGQGRLGEGDRRWRPSSAQEQRKKVGGSGGCTARQGREEEVAGEVQGAVESEGGLFIAAGRRFGRPERCTRGARAQWRFDRPGAAAALWEVTRRAAVLRWRASRWWQSQACCEVAGVLRWRCGGDRSSRQG
jgi:hypothetical protein